MSSSTADPYVAKALVLLEKACTEAGIPPSHGYGHALCVLKHAQLAVSRAEPALSGARALSVQLAAALHDIDDRKYFDHDDYQNARAIMNEALAEHPDKQTVLDDALRMISLVSASANGNSVPADAREAPELLWPRWCDRLEATGEIGIVRCYQYNSEKERPMSSEATPRPATEAEVWAAATQARFEAYAQGGGSASMVDHYYDKLLHISKPHELCTNAYLVEQAEARVAPLVELCLAYGRTGEVPVEMIKALVAKHSE